MYDADDTMRMNDNINDNDNVNSSHLVHDLAPFFYRLFHER